MVSRIHLLFLGVITASFLFITGCGASGGTVSSGSTLESGVASWYGPGFHGKQTANGERYNQNDMTAAHKTLPFNTVVRVTNLDNGKSVRVRINDRGPYVDNRVIDLSRRAAERIDMVDSGVARVRIQLVKEGDRPITRSNSSSRETFTVQLASYNTRNEAREAASKIPGSRVDEGVVNGRAVFRVYHGTYRTKEEAERNRQRLSRQGHNGFVKQVEN
jgi:rare lipoprotein A